MSDERKTRLRLTSDGTPQGTRIETEDGTLVKGIQKVRWSLEMGKFAKLQLEVLAVPVDVVGDLVDFDDTSMPLDTNQVPLLQEPQDAPEGPGFPEEPPPPPCLECGSKAGDPHHADCIYADD